MMRFLLCIALSVLERYNGGVYSVIVVSVITIGGSLAEARRGLGIELSFPKDSEACETGCQPDNMKPGDMNMRGRCYSKTRNGKGPPIGRGGIGDSIKG